MSPQSQPFHIPTLPLAGRQLIEASAGTGKSYSIIRIYLRLLLEQELSVDQILVMTFTKAATAELRNALAEMLTNSIKNWDSSTDDVIVHLRKKIEPNKVQLLLRRALLQLDEASIYTIHGFCKRALSQQAFHSGTSFRADMEADTSALKLTAAEDWYRQQQSLDNFSTLYNEWPTPEAFISYWRDLITRSDNATLPTLIDIEPRLNAHQANWLNEQEQFHKLNKPTARSAADTLQAYTDCFTALEQLSQPSCSVASVPGIAKSFSTQKKQDAMSSAYELATAIEHNQKVATILLAVEGVHYIQHHVDTNKDRLDQLDFDDLILQLKNAVTKPENEELRLILRDQFKAALVDEFQDTDPDQYAIIDSIYGKSQDHLVCMIGDPKQAIYAFRGGDVFAYLAARKDADTCWTMNTNYRSTKAVIDGYNQLFLQGERQTNSDVFGFNIDYHRVEPSPNAADVQFSDSSQRTAVQWVNFQPETETSKGLTKSFQNIIAQWCVNEVIKLTENTLRDGHTIPASDIAFLVRKKDEAELLQHYLTQAGLPSVYLSSRTSVFESAEAQDLLLLLRGIWQFENSRTLIAALACSWIGLDTYTLDAVKHDDNLWTKWQNQFEQWRQQWQQQGLMSLLLTVMKQHYKPRTESFDRQLTNMMQLSEILQKQSSQYRMPDALLHWFEQTLENPTLNGEHELRLESDDAIIKIMTMHGAKGLEYPIVFLPFISFYSKRPAKQASYRFHDRQTFSAKTTFLSQGNERRLSEEEEQKEMVRLLYVAATRAQHRLYGCMAAFQSFKDSNLGLTLQMPGFELQQIQSKLAGENEDEHDVNRAVSIIEVNEAEVSLLTAQAPVAEAEPKPALFNGHIERDWWLASFSSLTRHAGQSSHSTPDRDEGEQPETVEDSNALRFNMAKGAETGNLLHDTLEALDFNKPNYDDAFAAVEDRYKSSLKEISRTEFEHWLHEILQTPFAPDQCLANLTADKTLRESEFYFPMSGTGVKHLAQLLEQKRGDIVNLPEHQKLKGMMHGFIDLIFQVGDKFYVADYKSNYLGNRLEDYSFDAMKQSIEHSYYDVQYSIYALALHRYLELNLPNYKPEINFGGVYYFYLRGMSPEVDTEKNESYGVYFDPLSIDYLNALDTIFNNEQSERAS